MNRGYAFGFLLIILVVVLGFYVAYTAFTSARETVRAQATETPATQVAAAPTSPPPPTATATLTATAIAAPLPGITATLTAAVLPTEPGSPAETAPLGPTEAPTLTPAPPAGTPTGQLPTAEPTPAFAFRLAAPPGPDSSYPTCCYLVGTVRSAAGVPLEGILVRAANEWISLDPAATKAGGEAGQYNIPIGFDTVRWDLMIVDAGGTQISTKVSIDFDPNAANAIRIDWERAY